MLWLVGCLTLVEVVRLILSIQDNRHVRRLNSQVRKQQEAWQEEQIRWRNAELVELKEMVKDAQELKGFVAGLEAMARGESMTRHESERRE